MLSGGGMGGGAGREKCDCIAIGVRLAIRCMAGDSESPYHGREDVVVEISNRHMRYNRGSDQRLTSHAAFLEPPKVFIYVVYRYSNDRRL